jgi:hypothetical protein
MTPTSKYSITHRRGEWIVEQCVLDTPDEYSIHFDPDRIGEDYHPFWMKVQTFPDRLSAQRFAQQKFGH